MASFPYFEDLPLTVQANILSFTISHMNDFVCILRSLSRSIRDDIISMIPSIGGKHFIQCCAKTYTASFLSELMDLCYDYEDLRPVGGDSWKFQATIGFDADGNFQKNIFPGCTVVSIFFLPEARICDENDFPSEMDLISQGERLCHNATDSITLDDLNELWENTPNQSKTLEPIENVQNKGTEGNLDEEKPSENHDGHISHAILTLRVPKEDKFLHGYDSWDDAFNSGFLRLKCDEQEKRLADDHKMKEGIFPRKKDAGQRFRGYFSRKRPNDGTNSKWVDVRVPMKIVPVVENLWRDDHPFEQTYISFSSVLNKHQQKRVSEGVFIVDGLISKDFRDRMMKVIDCFKKVTLADYDPNSNNVVRALVNPALYAYVEGVSQTVYKPSDVPPCFFPSNDNSYSDNVYSDEGKDFWGREYKTSKYQWLPTYFNISNDGSCHICDYINNIIPVSSHSQFYQILEGLFERILPCIESVFSYVQEISPRIRRQTVEEPDYEYDEGESSNDPVVEKYTSLRGQRLQVITKILDYELKAGQSYEGVWHVEGMSHEEIVCTDVYRETALRNISAEIGSLAKRRIIVFFLVNPKKRIVSTREVSPQQKEGGGTMTREEAFYHRLELMKERKLRKQDWNVRPIVL